MLFGIDVIIIGPGAVKTAIWDKAEEIDISRYGNSPYLQILQNFQNTFIAQGRKGFPPEKLGRLIHKALTVANPKVRYSANPASIVEKTMMALAPKRTLDKIVARALGLMPK